MITVIIKAQLVLIPITLSERHKFLINLPFKLKAAASPFSQKKEEDGVLSLIVYKPRDVPILHLCCISLCCSQVGA